MLKLSDEEVARRNKALDAEIAKINGRKEIKLEGSGDFIQGMDLNYMKAEFLSTGIDQLDDALNGGLGAGSISVFWSMPGIGKTGIAVSTSTEVLKLNGNVLYIDAEENRIETLTDIYWKQFDPEFLAKHIRVVRPQKKGEDMLNTVLEMLVDPNTKHLKNYFDLIVIDSINNVVPQKVFDAVMKPGVDGGLDASMQMASKASLQTKFAELIMGGALLRNGCHLMVIAQARANMDSMGHGLKEKESISYALKFAAKQIVRLSKKPWPLKSGQETGHDVNIFVTKNNIKGGPKRGEYGVGYNGVGLDDSETVISKAEDWGYILKIKEGKKTKLVMPLSNGDWVFGGIAEIRKRAKVDQEFKNLVKELFTHEKPKKDSVVPKGYEAKVKPLEEVKGDGVDENEPVTE